MNGYTAPAEKMKHEALDQLAEAMRLLRDRTGKTPGLLKVPGLAMRRGLQVCMWLALLRPILTQPSAEYRLRQTTAGHAVWPSGSMARCRACARTLAIPIALAVRSWLRNTLLCPSGRLHQSTHGKEWGQQ